MIVKINLRFIREPELVALKCDPTVCFSGLVKEALRSYVRNRDFKITLSNKANYEKKPLCCNLKFDEEKDKDIIDKLNSINVPQTTFIRNIMMRYIKGDVDFVYTDKRLKEITQTGKSVKRASIRTEKKAEADPLVKAINSL